MYADLFTVRGRSALVTGGSCGVRLICAQTLGTATARTVGSSRSESDGAGADEFNESGIDATYADTTKRAGAGALVKAASSAIGSIDVLVNNACISQDGGNFGAEEAAWSELIETSLNGLCWRDAIADMVETEHDGSMARGGLDDLESTGIRFDSAPIGRCGQPRDVAAAIPCLVLNAASYITGSVLHIDGGYRIH